MKIAVVGHSLIAYKQYKMFETIGEKGFAECKAFCPSAWHTETGIPLKKKNFELKPLLATSQNWMHYWLKGLKQEVLEFYPDVLYIEQEPFSLFSLWCLKTFKHYSFKKALFTWENKDPKTTGYDLSVWKKSLELADLLVCGNEKSKIWNEKMSSIDLVEIPQSGIDVDLFKPMEMKKEFDIVFVGRLSEEKGIKMIEQVAKELELKILWVGGRGNVVPEYGTKSEWVSYVDLPMKYNKAKAFVSFTYSHQGYQEQFNYCIGEALACGIPAFASNNGSQQQVYTGSRAIIVEEKNRDELKVLLKEVMEEQKQKEDYFPYLHGLGRKWVVENLSNEVVGKKLVEAFEELL